MFRLLVVDKCPLLVVGVVGRASEHEAQSDGGTSVSRCPTSSAPPAAGCDALPPSARRRPETAEPGRRQMHSSGTRNPLTWALGDRHLWDRRRTHRDRLNACHYFDSARSWIYLCTCHNTHNALKSCYRVVETTRAITTRFSNMSGGPFNDSRCLGELGL